MNKDQYYENLIYLNAERLRINKSKELFIGKKVKKYVDLLKRFRLMRIVKELCHDTYAFFCKDVSMNRIIDFEKDAVNTFEKKVIVYTSIYGPYDTVLEPLCVDPDCEYYIFTDQEVPADSIWKKADNSLIPDECDSLAMKNRYVKMFPYKVFNCKYSIYLDGNLQLVGHPSQLVQKKLAQCKTGISMHLAPRENCIYEEVRNVCHIGKITPEQRDTVLKMYRQNNMPRHFGMCECNVIVRDHDNANMKVIMEDWWQNYCNGVKRDQLYFAYTVFKHGFAFSDVLNFGASVNDNIHFLRKEHL